MELFICLADSRLSLQMHNSAYPEPVKQAQWRAEHVGASTAARSSGRGVRQSLHLAASVR